MLDADTFEKRPLDINKQHEKIVFITPVKEGPALLTLDLRRKYSN